MKKKVLFISDSLANGGTERQLALLIKYLPPEWDRRVWSLGGGVYAQIIRDLGVQVDVCQRASRHDISPTLDLWRIINKEWRPDVVHSWGWMGSLAASPLCKLLRIPFVNGTIRFGEYYPSRGVAIRLSMFLADRIIANSQAGLRVWKINAQRGRVVYNGFDPTRWIPLNKTKWENEGPFQVVMVARMTEEKDYGSFFSAARILSKQRDKKWRFIAVGDGITRCDLMRTNRDLVESGFVEFPESNLEVMEHVNDSHIGVLLSPSRLFGEGCSNSIMEYMACGLPVICSDNGGNRELVLDGKTGFLVAPEFTPSLVEKLIWLYEHREVARRMGNAGRDRIKKIFSLNSFVGQVISIYQEVLYG